jgi:hypothetical protein
VTTVGDLLDQGVAWDQFADAPWDGGQLFTSAEDAEAHRDDEVAEWPEEEL